MKLIRHMVGAHLLKCRRSPLPPDSQTKQLSWAVSQTGLRHHSTHHERHPNGRRPYYAALAGVGLAAWLLMTRKQPQALSESDGRTHSKDPNKRVFTRQEVAKHDSLERGVWITYRGNVYDISEFVRHHPGGSHTIMMGAGGDVEPFWQTYTVHNASEVQNLLATYQIGVISPEELRAERESQKASKSDHDTNDPYSNDPNRNPLLKVLTQRPFNAETPGKLLPLSYLTPDDVFFVRNHLPVPEVDLADYTLTICLGSDGDPDNQQALAQFTLDQLKSRFKAHSVDSVIQCSGNRRRDLKKIKEIKGLDWEVGAISNARWTGVRLVDLLESLDGLKPDQLGSIKHVQVEGLDSDMTGQSYGASVSADLALDPNREVILAYEMNGQPLSRDHGFPLRFIAPGVTGARNVKWLSKIILSHEESNSHWQRKDYKSFSPNVDMFNLNFDDSISIQETPVQSAICDPAEGDQVTIDCETNSSPTLPLKGYAYSGGGKMIVRVDVSLDGGLTWLTADLLDTPKTDDGKPDYTKRNQIYSWTRWSLSVPIPPEIVDKKSGTLQILCRAFDSSYNSQPERPDSIWNVRGVVNNSWHKISVDVKLIG